MSDFAVPDDQLTAILDVVQYVLGREVEGAYLYGSAVMSGLRRASDLDLFVVVGRPTTLVERRELVERLSPISDRTRRPHSWRPIELTIVVQSDVHPWRFPPRTDFQYGEWLRADFDAGQVDPAEPHNPDLAVMIEMVRRASTPLLGVPAEDALLPVPRDDLIKAMRESIPGLMDDLASDTANVILTLARIWSTLATDTFRSKDDAADWALARLPARHRSFLEHARAEYMGDEDGTWDWPEEEILGHADYVVRRIMRMGAPTGRSRPSR